MDDDAKSLHCLLERISALFRSELRGLANGHGLKLVQLEALIYLSIANRYSDTAGALAEYLGITKGTASQTVKALHDRALLTKEVDADDGRVLHCVPTSTGRCIADEAYPGPFLAEMSLADEAATAATDLLRALQAHRGSRTFGQCQTCRHFERVDGQTRCGLTKESLSAHDALKICREHAA